MLYYNHSIFTGLFKHFIPIYLLFLMTNVFAQGNSSKLYGEQEFILEKTLQKYHYNPVALNDSTSKKILNNFIESLDPFGLYFNKKEISDLQKWNLLIDDEISQKSIVFLKEVTELYQKKVTLADTIVSEILSKPLNFTIKDTIFFHKKQQAPNFAGDDIQLKTKWTKWLKYQLLVTLYQATDEADDPFLKDIKTILLKEPDARAKVLKKNKRKFNRILYPTEGFENQVAGLFFNAMVACYDPHSSFFSAKEKQKFESYVSPDELSFGIDFYENKNGEIEITDLVPGGSGWNSNQLHKGDIILEVTPESNKAIDLSYSSIEEAYDIIQNISTLQADFKLRKINGQINKVTLAKSKLQNENNIVKSYFLKGEKKIGYITLPSFYSDWSNNNPLGCANDVAKEIVKLQEEGIEGLVLDLRYNGGGSVAEAIGLAGLFIDEGPLAIYKLKNEKPLILKDMNRGAAYNGPLLVLTNGISASASELFAGAIQDYNRGIIAGGATYGKATGQIIIPLDTTFSIAQETYGITPKGDDQLGYLKVTIEKFYRVTNSSHQKSGVIPDIALPEPFYFSDYKESSSPNALSKDSIVKKVIYSPLPKLPLKLLEEKSTARIKQNKSFTLLKTYNDSLALLVNQNKPILLNPKDFKKGIIDLYRLTELMSEAASDSSNQFVVLNNTYDKKVMDMDDYSKNVNTKVLDDIQNDIFTQEAYLIVKDLITFVKN